MIVLINKEKRIMENIASIGITAGCLIAEGLLVVEDYNTLRGGILKFADYFEYKYSYEGLDHDYTETIEKFARFMLLKYYGIDLD